MEITEYLGVSTETIEGHMTRAFKLLSDRLGEKFKTILFIVSDLRVISTIKLKINS